MFAMSKVLQYHSLMNLENVLFSLEDIYLVYFFSFEFRLRISLAEDGYLTMISRIRNINCKPFSFSFAYRTYISISDIRYRIYIVDKSFVSLTSIFYESQKYFLHLLSFLNFFSLSCSF